MESSQKRIRELEKSNTSLRKEAAEASERAGLAEKLANEAVDSVKVAEANLKLEKEVSQLEIDSLKEALKCLENEKQSLVEQLENIAFEATAKERHTLMKQYLAANIKIGLLRSGSKTMRAWLRRATSCRMKVIR